MFVAESGWRCGRWLWKKAWRDIGDKRVVVCCECGEKREKREIGEDSGLWLRVGKM